MARKLGAGVADSREQLLDAAERLMSTNGYAGTAVSAICKAAGVAPTSLYWHFGSKEGLLAAVMERGAARWFDALPRWGNPADATAQQAELVAQGASAVGSDPMFLNLFYLLALDGAADEVAGALVARIRTRARDYFLEAIIGLLSSMVAEEEIARRAAVELTRFAVAFSDGCYFATRLEPDQTDLPGMYADLVTAIRALAPAAIARAGDATGNSEQENG